jgi:hypothetical protein
MDAYGTARLAAKDAESAIEIVIAQLIREPVLVAAHARQRWLALLAVRWTAPADLTASVPHARLWNQPRVSERPRRSDAVSTSDAALFGSDVRCDRVRGGSLGRIDAYSMVPRSQIVRLDETVELCIRGSLGGDQAIIGSWLCSHEFVELALRHQLLAVLRVLDGEHHHDRDGRRR